MAEFIWRLLIFAPTARADNQGDRAACRAEPLQRTVWIALGVDNSRSSGISGLCGIKPCRSQPEQACYQPYAVLEGAMSWTR